MKKLFLFILLCFGFMISLAQTVVPDASGIIYVKQNAVGNGSSWSNALPQLADALKFAKLNNAIAANPQVTQIWVARGDYKPLYSPEDGVNFGTDKGRDNAFLLVNNVKLYGGFDPDAGKTTMATRNPKLAVSRLEGNNIGGLNYHIMIAIGTASENFYVNGFTLSNGGDSFDNAVITVNNRPVRQNLGGGLYIDGNAEVEESKFISNTMGVLAWGDGTMQTRINRCVFDNNYSIAGGGLYIASKVSVTNCLFSNNAAYNGGGAIHIGGGIGYIFNNNLINNLSTNQRGGGIYMINSSAIIYNNYFKDNRHNVSDIVSAEMFADFSAASPATVDFDYNFVQKHKAGVAHNITTGSLQNAGDPLTNTPGYKVQVGGLDHEGITRIQGSSIDIGYTEVIEYTPDANGVVYVNGNTPNDGNGSSWSEAAKDLAKVIDAAKFNTSIKKVWVAKGTYLPMFKAAALDQNSQATTNEAKAFVWSKDLKVFGGFAGTEDAAVFNLDHRDFTANETILSGNLNGNNTNNAYHVVLAVGDMGLAELNGFTVSGGKTSGQFSGMDVKVNNIDISSRSGAGICLVNASFILNWMVVKQNSTDAINAPSNSGGGLYFKSASATTALKVSNSSFNANDAGIGGGAYHEGGTVNYDRVIFADNQAEARGGGASTANANATFLNTQFIRNKVVQVVPNRGGGAVYHGSTTGTEIKYVNSIFRQNQSPVGGVATHNGSNLKASFINCTFYQNKAMADAGLTAAVMHAVGTPEIAVFNSILFGNEVSDANDLYEVYPQTANIIIKNSITQQYGTNGVNGNKVGIDPLFVNALGGDFNLQRTSPAVNAGDNSFYAGLNASSKDLAGHPRIMGAQIDLGPFELQNQAQTITVANLVKTYGDADFEPGATASSGLAINYVSADPAIAETYQDAADGNKWKLKIKKAGTLNITASQAGGAGFDPAPDQVFSLTIEPKPLTITATGNNKVYDGTVTATVVLLHNALAGDVVSTAYTSAIFDNKNVGNAKPINVSGLTLTGADASNYTFNTTTSTVGNVTPFALTVSASGNHKVYDGLATASVNLSSNAFASDVISLAYASASFADKNVGNNKNINVTGIGLSGIDAGNYTFNTAATTTANITAMAITITAVAKNKLFGDADPSLTYSFSPALITGDVFTGTLSRVPGEAVGNYAIAQGSLILNSNYTLNYIGNNLTIGARVLTIMADAKQKDYGAPDPVLTYRSTGLVGFDVIQGALMREAGENRGAYVIQQGSLSAGPNYTVVYVSAHLQINPKMLTITADAKSKTYGDLDPVLTYQVSGQATGDAISGALSRQAGEQAGTYLITQGTLMANGNYTVQYVGNQFSITKKIVIVTASAKQKVYGDPDPMLSYTFSPSLLNGDSFSGNLSRTIGENAGDYQVTLGTLSAGANYAITYQSASLLITKAILNVSANPSQMCQSSNVPVFTLSYQGFKGSDREGSIAVKPRVQTTANSGSLAGNYTLVPNGGVATNYDFSYTNGVLTINSLPQLSIVSSRGGSISKGETLTLTANGATSYSWSGPNGIIAGQQTAILTLRPTASGVYTVTGTNAKGCTSQQTFSVTVRDDFQAINSTNLLTPNGDGYNDYWKVDNIDVYPDNEVKIFDRAGRMIYSKKGYDNSWAGTVNGVALAEGTYYYVIDFGDGKPKQKGFITLVRESRR